MPQDAVQPQPTVIGIDPGVGTLVPLGPDPYAVRPLSPVQNHHPDCGDPAIGMAVGVRYFTTMREAFGPCPGDDCIGVLDRGFGIVDADGAEVTRTGERAATFRTDRPVSRTQEGYLRKISLALLALGTRPPRFASAAGAVCVFDPAPRPLAAPGPEGRRARLSSETTREPRPPHSCHGRRSRCRGPLPPNTGCAASSRAKRRLPRRLATRIASDPTATVSCRGRPSAPSPSPPVQNSS